MPSSCVPNCAHVQNLSFLYLDLEKNTQLKNENLSYHIMMKH